MKKSDLITIILFSIIMALFVTYGYAGVIEKAESLSKIIVKDKVNEDN